MNILINEYKFTCDFSLFSLQMRVFDAKLNAKKTQWDVRIALWFGVNAIIHSIIVACHYGSNKTIVVHFVNKNGPSNAWENKSNNPYSPILVLTF